MGQILLHPMRFIVNINWNNFFSCKAIKAAEVAEVETEVAEVAEVAEALPLTVEEKIQLMVNKVKETNESKKIKEKAAAKTLKEVQDFEKIGQLKVAEAQNLKKSAIALNTELTSAKEALKEATKKAQRAEAQKFFVMNNVANQIATAETDTENYIDALLEAHKIK